jgi:hypothetical protein
MTRFVRALEGATIAWPLNARAQQPAIPVIGFLNSASPEAFGPYVAGFRQGLPSHMQPVVALFIFKRKLGQRRKQRTPSLWKNHS